MTMLRGSCSAEVDYPIERCWAVVSDLEHAPEWQRTLTAVTVIERDDEGRPSVCDTVNDAKLRQVSVRVRLTYSAPTELRFSYVSGDDLDDLEGGWVLESLGPERTRATYSLGLDPGPIPFFARPLEKKLRGLVMGHQADELAAALAAGRGA